MEGILHDHFLLRLKACSIPGATAAIFAAVALLFVMQGVGMPGVGNLGVIWATEILGVGEEGFALMAFGWGGGAVAGSMYFAQRPDVAGRGSTLVLAAIAFAVSAIIFAYSRSIWLTAATNVGLGISLAASTVSASVIIQQKVVEGMRGRVMGLLPLTQGFAMLLTLPISAVAQGVGLPIVLSVLGWTTLALAAVIILVVPQIRRVRPETPDLAPATPGRGRGWGSQDARD